MPTTPPPVLDVGGDAAIGGLADALEPPTGLRDLPSPASLGAPRDGDDGAAIPTVEFAPGASFFADDDDEELPPAWSLVQSLVRAPDKSEEKAKQVVVEVIHYRGEMVLDHAELGEGERYVFGRAFTKDWCRDRGIPGGLTLVDHKRKNVAEIRVGDLLQGRVLHEGQQHDLRSLPEAQGKGGKVRLTEGDFASLDVLGDKVFIRFARVPKVTATPEQIVEEKAERRLFFSSTGSAVGVWLFLGVIAWVAQYRGLQERVIQLEDEGFAEVIEEAPELEIPEPEEPEEPELPEEPKPEEPPKAEDKPETPQPTPPQDAPKKPGVLDALKNLPQPKSAGNQSLTAALSNVKGVNVPGASSFKVSSMVGKGIAGVQVGGAAGGVDTSSLNSILRKGGGVGQMASGSKRDVKGQVKTLKQASKLKGQGILSKEEIQKVINSHVGEIQYCYEKQLRTTPGLAGKVILEWTIGTDGRVKVVKSSNSTLKSAEAINCMMTKVKTWKFPEPRGNGSVIVTYPFIFNTI